MSSTQDAVVYGPVPRFSTGGKHPGEFDAHDAAVLAHISPLAITSPNCGWVPEPFFSVDEPVQVRADGRFGTVDIYQWPQLYCTRYPWSIAILRNMVWPSNSAMPWAWYNPSYADFEPMAGTTLDVGYLKEEKRLGLRKLGDETKKRFATYKKQKCHEREGDQSLKIMQHVRSALNHIERFPLSWRDTVACVAEFQRGVLECLAYLDYYQVILPRCEKPSFPYPELNQFWMGAFTTDHQIAEMLYRAGVPVWFVRHDDTIGSTTIIREVVVTHSPCDIVQGMYSDPVTATSKPFPVRYVGTDTFSRQQACRGHYKGEEMEAYAIFVASCKPDQDSTSLLPAQNAEETRKEHRKDRAKSRKPYSMPRSRGSVQENRSKWVDLDHPLMPPRHTLWAEALANCATCLHKDVNHRNMGAGYQFPEPASFVTAQSTDTRSRYLANWLVLRPLWLGVKRTPPPPPKHWRAFFNSRPQDAQDSSTSTHTAEVRKVALDFFGDMLPSVAQGLTWAKNDKVSFRGSMVFLGPTQAFSDRFVQDVLWELSELCFRAELLSLDKFLAPLKWDHEPLQREELYDSIFESPVIGGSWDGPLPDHSFGLHHNYLRDVTFLSSVNSLRCLMTPWPRADKDNFLLVPVDNSMSEGHLRHSVLRIMRFYVRSFFYHTGRPPVVPRCLPVHT